MVQDASKKLPLSETESPAPDVHAHEASGPSEQIAKSKKVATIIETRPLDSLVPLILHFSAVLGPDWPIVLVTDPAQAPPSFKSAPFLRLQKAGQLFIVALPTDVKFVDSIAVSKFLTSPWIWEQLAPADHVLLFQADSILCANSLRAVDDFLQYDFIGAPIWLIWGQGYNGGLSLRNRNVMLSIVAQSSFAKELEQQDHIAVEDQWYYKKMKELPAKPDGSPGANLPTVEVATEFVVEGMWHDSPLGYHQVERWQKDNLSHVDKWCPEWRIVGEGYHF